MISLPEYTWDYELRAVSGDDYSLSPLVIYGYLKIGDTSDVNGSMNSHTLSKKYWYLKMVMWVVEVVL